MRELQDLAPEELAELQAILGFSPTAKAVIWTIWGICVVLMVISLCYLCIRG